MIKKYFNRLFSTVIFSAFITVYYNRYLTYFVLRKSDIQSVNGSFSDHQPADGISGDEAARPLKYILLWNEMPDKMTPFLGTGREGLLRHGCDVSECYIVNHEQRHLSNKSMDSYDAVVFNMNKLHYFGPIPWTAKEYR